MHDLFNAVIHMENHMDLNVLVLENSANLEFVP